MTERDVAIALSTTSQCQTKHVLMTIIERVTTNDGAAKIMSVSPAISVSRCRHWPVTMS